MWQLTLRAVCFYLVWLWLMYQLRPDLDALWRMLHDNCPPLSDASGTGCATSAKSDRPQ